LFSLLRIPHDRFWLTSVVAAHEEFIYLTESELATKVQVHSLKKFTTQNKKKSLSRLGAVFQSHVYSNTLILHVDHHHVKYRLVDIENIQVIGQ
jgi:hypothetical protein